MLDVNVNYTLVSKFQWNLSQNNFLPKNAFKNATWKCTILSQLQHVNYIHIDSIPSSSFLSWTALDVTSITCGGHKFTELLTESIERSSQWPRYKLSVYRRIECSSCFDTLQLTAYVPLFADIYLHLCVRHIDGLVQERRNSSALALESRLSCINPWIYIMVSVCIYNGVDKDVNINVHVYLLTDPIIHWRQAWWDMDIINRVINNTNASSPQ